MLTRQAERAIDKRYSIDYIIHLSVYVRYCILVLILSIIDNIGLGETLFSTISDAEKDLGILIDNKLMFHKQCSTAVNIIIIPELRHDSYQERLSKLSSGVDLGFSERGGGVIKVVDL